MRQISIKAILVGNIINILMVWFLLYFISSAIYDFFVAVGIYKDKTIYPPYTFAITLTIISILSGYISARIAKRSEILNGAFAIILYVFGEISQSIVEFQWKDASIGMLLFAAAFGGYLCLFQKRKYEMLSQYRGEK